MTKIALILGTAAAIAVAAPAMAQVMPPAEYVAVAGASDLYEIDSSKLVLETTKDPKLRSFAEMMIRDHTKSTDMVKKAAADAKVTAAPQKLNPAQTEMIEQLRAEKGPARDAAYLAQQRVAHNQALLVQKAYAADGTAAPLKTAAGEIVPVVQEHIKALQGM